MNATCGAEPGINGWPLAGLVKQNVRRWCRRQEVAKLLPTLCQFLLGMSLTPTTALYRWQAEPESLQWGAWPAMSDGGLPAAHNEGIFQRNCKNKV